MDGDIFTKARQRLLSKEPWYGHMAISCDWQRSKRINGVGTYMSMTMPVIVYNPDYAETLELEQAVGVIEHIINHLVRLHTSRQWGRDDTAWHIATDMSVNGSQNNPHLTHLPPGDIIYVPDEWDAFDSAESLYNKIIKQTDQQGNQSQPQQQDGQQGQSGMSGQGEDGEESDEESCDGGGGGREEGEEGDEEQEGEGGQSPNGKMEYGDFGGDAVDDHNMWEEGDASEEESRQIMKSYTDEATKQQGYTPGHLQEAIDDLKKPVVSWQNILKRHIGRYVGNSRYTWSRLHRRHGWPNKGISHRAASTVTVVVDTSGSISQDELQQFFGEIDAIAHKAKVFLLQWDFGYQAYFRYNKRDWKNISARGRGGTDMSEPVKWIAENGGPGNLCVLLTDGCCNWPPPQKFPTIFVITDSNQQGPEWGEVVYTDDKANNSQ